MPTFKKHNEQDRALNKVHERNITLEIDQNRKPEVSHTTISELPWTPEDDVLQFNTPQSPNVLLVEECFDSNSIVPVAKRVAGFQNDFEYPKTPEDVYREWTNVAKAESSWLDEETTNSNRSKSWADYSVSERNRSRSPEKRNRNGSSWNRMPNHKHLVLSSAKTAESQFSPLQGARDVFASTKTPMQANGSMTSLPPIPKRRNTHRPSVSCNTMTTSEVPTPRKRNSSSEEMKMMDTDDIETPTSRKYPVLERREMDGLFTEETTFTDTYDTIPPMFNTSLHRVRQTKDLKSSIGTLPTVPDPPSDHFVNAQSLHKVRETKDMGEVVQKIVDPILRIPKHKTPPQHFPGHGGALIEDDIESSDTSTGQILSLSPHMGSFNLEPPPDSPSEVEMVTFEDVFPESPSHDFIIVEPPTKPNYEYFQHGVRICIFLLTIIAFIIQLSRLSDDETALTLKPIVDYPIPLPALYFERPPSLHIHQIQLHHTTGEIDRICGPLRAVSDCHPQCSADTPVLCAQSNSCAEHSECFQRSLNGAQRCSDGSYSELEFSNCNRLTITPSLKDVFTYSSETQIIEFSDSVLILPNADLTFHGESILDISAMHNFTDLTQDGTVNVADVDVYFGGRYRIFGIRQISASNTWQQVLDFASSQLKFGGDYASGSKNKLSFNSHLDNDIHELNDFHYTSFYSSFINIYTDFQISPPAHVTLFESHDHFNVWDLFGNVGGFLCLLMSIQMLTMFLFFNREGIFPKRTEPKSKRLEAFHQLRE